MCLGCERLWTALHVLWSTMYIFCGAAQLLAGIFFLLSVHELQHYSILVAGSWNVVAGIAVGVTACIWGISTKRQEFLLYVAFTILAANVINMLLTEWTFYFTDMSHLLRNYSNSTLINYAWFGCRIATAAAVAAAFLDSQLSFCSMQAGPLSRRRRCLGGRKAKARQSHEQGSDIEYIIPRPKSSKPHTVYDAYAQSWVFDAENSGGTCSQNGTTTAESPYLKILQNGTPKTRNEFPNGAISEAPPHVTENPVVHIEEASDESPTNSDRKICHMRSFSRSASPVVQSMNSSQISLNQTAPAAPIYDCLEKLTEPTLYRSRLNTVVSNREEIDDQQHYQAPHVSTRRVEPISPHVEKVQYASLMKELQKAIVGKKEPSSGTSPQSASESASDKTQTNSSQGKNSDAEFSKELEAALQLIQDLESPNTVETPSELKSPAEAKADTRQLTVWRNSDDASESEKTLSAVGSLMEINSPHGVTQLSTFKPSANGKGASVVVHYPDSQSTSGYSSPTHGPTPNWSTTSSINGSNNDIPTPKPISYSIHNAKSTTVISLYSQPCSQETKSKSVTLVNITDNTSPVTPNTSLDSSIITDVSFTSCNTDSTLAIADNTVKEIHSLEPSPNKLDHQESQLQGQQQAIWNVKSLLRKKKQNTRPKLCPELEGAIIKSESLAYLSELELLERIKRSKEMQREVEERVIQQLHVPRTESHC